MEFFTKYLHWKYRNTILLAVAMVLLIIFADHAIVRGIVSGISGLRFVGIILAGMFYVSTFTIVPATLLLSEMSKIYGFWETVLLATVGAIIGDYLIFRFIKDTVAGEVGSILKSLGKERHLVNLFKSPLFAWMLPVLGAVIIASPLPDEFGLSVWGISQMNSRKFIFIVAILDLIGMLLLVSLLKSL